MDDSIEAFFLNDYLQIRENNYLIHLDTTTYTLFLKTLNALMATNNIDNEDTIIALAKLFFAKNEQEALLIEQNFSDAIQEKFTLLGEQISILSAKSQALEAVTTESLENSNLANQPESEQEQEVVPTADATTNESTPTVPNETITEENEKDLSIDTEQWQDVNLHLLEDEVLRNNRLPLQLDGNYFLLHDETIMPFSIRYLSQKSRKSFQTNHKITANELDIPAMVKSYAKDELFDQIIYQKRPVNQSNIVLLSDRFGSMLSYEYLEDHLIRSFEMIPECLFEQYFFYNLPEKYFEPIFSSKRQETAHKKKELKYKETAYYTLKNAKRGGKTLITNKAKWNKETIFFIFSDAGGHSGLVNKTRIRATLGFWKHLKEFSEKIFWLNPIPIQEMNDCTAKRLNLIIKMYEPDYKGFEDLFKKNDSLV